MNLLRLLAILCILGLSAITVQATITNESNRVDQTGNGSTTVFAYTFKITDKTHLNVYVNGTLKTVDVDYTVSGVGNDAGGNVTFTTAPSSGHRVILLRNVPLTQATAYTQGGKFPAASHEAALDKLTMQIQQLKERLDRAPTLTPQNSVGLTPLALPGVQASSYLRWNSAGTALENAATVADGQTIPLPLPIAQGGTGQNTEALARQALDVPSNAEAVLDTFMDAKGDLISASAADTPTRLAVGTNGTVLTADSTAAGGIAWTAAGFTTGDVKLTIKTTADSGWVLMNDGTIGSASSGATTRANADTQPLYELLWTNCANAQCAVSTGRGASAAADFAANKTIALPKALGRALATYGTGSGLTARALGQTLGEETHVLTTNEMPSHSHNFNSGTRTIGVAGSGGSEGYSTAAANTAQSGSTASAGSGAAHNVMQPTLFLNVMIKL